MANIIIIHGAYGNPDENWFPWLKQQLEQSGHNVIIPEFPTPENQSLNSWKKEFEKYENYIDSNTLLIGHSIGAAFLLNLLEEIHSQVNATFLVSGFVDLLGNETFDRINKSFVARQFDWSKINNNCRHFAIYHSDNDPYVPLQIAEKMAKKLNTKIKVIKSAGHFNKSAGYTKFEVLLEDVLARLNKRQEQ